MVTVVETCPTLLVKGLVTEVMSKKGALSTCGGTTEILYLYMDSFETLLLWL